MWNSSLKLGLLFLLQEASLIAHLMIPKAASSHCI